jgi:hypothetical protein
MTKEIRFNAFAMNCTGHMAPGLWRHPQDRSDRYVDLTYWTELAQLLERGKIDALFPADVLGPYNVDGFNLAYVLMPETYQNIVDLLVPELQRRGVYKKEYRHGTLREKLFQLGPYLTETHPGYRRALSGNIGQRGPQDFTKVS